VSVDNTSGSQVGFDQIATGFAVGALAVALAVVLGRNSRRRKEPRAAPEAPPEAQATVTAGRELNRAAGALALSVLADSGLEHYRAYFFNPAMYTPLAVSALTLGASAHGAADRREAAHVLRDTIYAAAALTGLAGTAFHVYNVMRRREGGLNWQSLFYGAPLGAPFAILLSGFLGVAAEQVRDTRRDAPPRLFGAPAGRAAAAVASFGLLGTSAEAGLLHFRGAYHNPFMFVPVTIPPVASLLMAEAALGAKGRDRTFSRWWLRLTAAIGFAGMGFHAYGVHRNMGGWRNWRQNLLNGPPIPAPPAFTGMALAGLAALNLLENHRDA
jgi:hypothetical protein